MKTRTSRFLVLTALTLLIIAGYSPGLYAQSWFDTGWGFRKSHVITGSADAGTNYQVRIIAHKSIGTDNGSDVYMGNNVLDNFGDVRFTASDGTTLLDYWMETGSVVSGSQAAFWVEVAADLGTSQTIYVYYGNISTTTTSDGASTFILFDDFTGTSLDLDAKWTKVNVGTPTFESGLMTISADEKDPGKIIATGGPTVNNNAIVARLKVTAGNTSGERAGVGVRTRIDNGGTPQTAIGTGYNYVFGSKSGWTNNLSFLDDQVAWGNNYTYAWTTNTNYIMEIFHDGTNVRGRINYGTWNTQNWTSRTGYLSLNIGSFDATTVWDWAFIRKCIASEPTHGFWGDLGVNVFYSSGSFIVPAGIISLNVQCWGGGGAAGRSKVDNGKGGGGGGAYAGSDVTVIPGNAYTVTVGAGGIAGTDSGPGSTPGGPSSFSTSVIALGGSNGDNTPNIGTGGVGGLATGSTGTIKYSGGTGGDGNTAPEGGGGGGGSSATISGNGVNGNNASGTTGGTGGDGTDGDGGNGGNNTISGFNGTSPGGGGGGRGDVGPLSGNGGSGQVIITWCTTAAPIVTSPVTYCLNATPSQLIATGSNLLWYTTPTGGTGSSTAPTPSTSSTGTTSYYVSQATECESPRAQIDVIVHSPVISINGQSNISCNGGSDGSITIQASGGIAPYEFSIDNGVTYTAGSNPYTFNGLSANVPYEIRVIDSTGCQSPAIP